MGRLLSGTAFNMGPEPMPDAISRLENGPITLMGTLGPPDFNTTSGTRSQVGSAWCVDTFGVTQSDVLRYRAASGEMEGSMESCIPGF
jgi:hypothetical protein